MQGSATCLLAPPVNNDLFPTTVEDVTLASADYEVYGLECFRRVPPMYKAAISDEFQRFKNAFSDVAALLEQFSTFKSFELSKAEDFINRYDLYNAIEQAYIFAAEIFGHELPTTLEYCNDTEDSTLEWLDFNLIFDSNDDTEIEHLLDKVDELSSMFEEKVGIEKASNVNFYLDIK